MKIYGYSKSNLDNLMEMKEVTLQADENDLKVLIKFFKKCMRNMPEDDWEHEHFIDVLNEDKYDGPDIIVYKK